MGELVLLLELLLGAMSCPPPALRLELRHARVPPPPPSCGSRSAAAERGREGRETEEKEEEERREERQGVGPTCHVGKEK